MPMNLSLGLGLGSIPVNEDVGVAPPVNLVAPVISGTPTLGQTLVCTPGTWSGDPVLTYQWTADGVPISGETDPEGLTLTSAQEGKEIRCEEYAVNAGGSAVAISNALTFEVIELNPDLG